MKDIERGSNRCPQCGRPVVIKSGKYGPFYGCTNWPSCDFTFAVEYDEEFDIDNWKRAKDWDWLQGFLAEMKNG